MARYYDYENILNAATANDASQDDINALGEWFYEYGMEYWNGEYFDAGGLRLYPVIENNDLGCGDVVGYEFK